QLQYSLCFCLKIGAHALSLSFGLSASFNPSPIKLIDKTVKNIAMPGNVTDHQLSKMYGRLLPIIRPQLILLGSPKPRNDRPASNRIAVPMDRVAATISGARALGKMTFQMIRPLLAPI